MIVQRTYNCGTASATCKNRFGRWDGHESQPFFSGPEAAGCHKEILASMSAYPSDLQLLVGSLNLSAAGGLGSSLEDANQAEFLEDSLA